MFDPEKITFFAKTHTRGQEVPFGIKAQDRQRHMYVIGKTGMGKSTLLENMAAQDIINGEGMCFMDPHGSAIETLLEYVPEHRIDDVVYFAPFDMNNPISFNMMEDVGADTRHLVVSGLMSTFKKIWEDAWSARMEYILTNALLALIEYPNTTLLSVNRMLADAKYRAKVVDHIKDPAVKAYWVDEFANYTERFAAEALPAIQNKIGQFTGNPLIRNIIGQPKSSFDVRKLMDEKKILLVNLSKGLVGETNADLLGSMLITRIYLSAMSRAELPPAEMKKMPNFYFYVDEFQSFANSTFANILSEARKYHLNLIIAHQYVEQMEEQIRNAVFGNVGTTIAFRVGPFDAEALEKVFEPQFTATDLVNIGPYQIYLTMMIDGAGSPPFSAATLPPVETPPVSHRNMVIARSRANYTKPREEVEQLVTDLHTPEERVEASADGKGGNKGAFNTPKFGVKVGQPPRGGNGKGGGNNNGRGGGNGGNGNNGDRRPNGGNNQGGNGNGNQSRDQRPKPPVPEKNLDDLRSILKGMSGTEKKEEQKTDGGNDRKPESRLTEKLAEKAPERPQENQTRPHKDTTKPAPENREQHSTNKQGGARPGEWSGKTGKSDTKAEGGKEDALKSALADALAKHQSQKQPTEKREEKREMSPEPAPVAPPQAQTQQPQSTPAPAVANESVSQSNGPDPKVMKKMLRNSGKERNPFTS